MGDPQSHEKWDWFFEMEADGVVGEVFWLDRQLVEAEPWVDCMEGRDEQEIEGREFDEIDPEVWRGGRGLRVCEKHELSPEQSETEPAAPAMDVLECVMRGEAESWVGCDNKRKEETEKDIGECHDCRVPECADDKLLGEETGEKREPDYGGEGSTRVDAAVFVDFCEDTAESERCRERDQPGHFKAGVDYVVLADEECYHDIC